LYGRLIRAALPLPLLAVSFVAVGFHPLAEHENVYLLWLL
jgi:hypothetical protein